MLCGDSNSFDPHPARCLDAQPLEITIVAAEYAREAQPRLHDRAERPR